MKTPPQHIIDAAVTEASQDRDPTRPLCTKSLRGAALYRRGFPPVTLIAVGRNAQPPGFACDGSEACRAACGKLCEHAEAAVLRSSMRVQTLLNDFEMLHVKVVDGELVPSGPPSCWQCSRAILADERIAGMWLFHETGWRRYTPAEFHRLTLIECGLPVLEFADG